MTKNNHGKDHVWEDILLKRQKSFKKLAAISMEDCDKVPPTQLHNILDYLMSHTTSKIKVCVFFNDDAFVDNLSETGKSKLLSELAFQMLRVASILTLVTDGHGGLLEPCILAQDTESLRSRHDLAN